MLAGGVTHGGLIGTRWSAAPAFRLFPTPKLQLDLGVGFVGADGPPETDPVLAVRGQLPFRHDGLVVSLFAERRVDGGTFAGLEVALGPSDLRELARSRAWRPLR